MKNWRQIGKYFKLNSMRRIVILGATVIAALLAIILGSTLYTTKSNNVKKSLEYTSSYEYNVKVNKASSDKTSLNTIAEDIYNRIDPIGLKGVQVTPYSKNGDEYVKIIYPNIAKDSSLKDEIATEITRKPQFTITTSTNQPIFDSHGQANSAILSGTGTSWTFDQDLTNFNIKESNVPITGAKVVNNNGVMQIHLMLDQAQISQWYTAAILLNQNSSSTSASSTPKVSNKLTLWFDLDRWIDALKHTTTPTGNLWSDSSFNPYNALYTQNDPTNGILRTHDSFFRSDATDYRFTELPLTTSLFSQNGELVIKDGFDKSKINEIVDKLNFNTAKYELAIDADGIYFHNPHQGKTAFRNFIIWGAVAFAIIAIALMINYGLLGALATISLALFTFITITLFTVMRGEYSPEFVAALIVGMGLSLDMNISTFERIKGEIYLGQNLKKANQVVNKKGSWAIVDSNVITLLLATILFYFGTKSIIGFSVTLVISILLTFVVSTLFTLITSALLLRSGYFDNKLKWVGVNKTFDEKIQVGVAKVDFVNASRWPFFGFIMVMVMGVIAMIVWGVLKSSPGVFVHSQITTKIITDAVIAIAISYAFILVYTMVRFRWTYVVALLYTSLQDVLLLLSFFAITRFNTSPTFVAALLGMLAFSLCDKLIIFDRLRENIKTKQNLADFNQIKATANETTRVLFKRTVTTNGLIIIALAILMAFNNILTWQVGLALLMGIAINLITNLYVLPMIWTKMEIVRQKGIMWRTKKNFWDIKDVEEQTISGINDFKY